MTPLPFTDRILHALMKKNGLPCPKSISYFREGSVNPIALINGEWVVKVNMRDPDLPKSGREAFCLARAGQQGLPVPKLIALDTSQEILPYSYMMMSRLSGQTLHSIWPGLPASQQQFLIDEAAQLLNQMHEIQFPAFGNVPGTGTVYAQWPDYVSATLESHIWKAQTCCVMDDKTADQIRVRAADLLPVLEIGGFPALVHADFHLGNLLSDGHRITGIIDFEWAIAGDPEWDLIDPFSLSEAWEGFSSAYWKWRPPTATFPTKQILYRLWKHTELVSVAAQHWGAKQVRYQQSKIEEYLAAAVAVDFET